MTFGTKRELSLVFPYCGEGKREEGWVWGFSLTFSLYVTTSSVPGHSCACQELWSDVIDIHVKDRSLVTGVQYYRQERQGVLIRQLHEVFVPMDGKVTQCYPQL